MAAAWLAAALFVVTLCLAGASQAAELTFNRAYQGSLSGQTFTTTTLLNADAGSIRFADGGTQRSFQNTSGTLYYTVGGVPFSETGVLNSRYPNGNTQMNAVAFSGSGGDRLLVLSGSYTTAAAYSGSSNAIVTKLNEYVDATAPDPANTTLTINGGSSASVSVGGSATIVVTVKLGSGTAVSGATVTLSANPAGTTSWSPSSTATNASGQATFTVQGLSAGTVAFNAVASSGGTTTTTTSSVTLNVAGSRSAAQTTASVPSGVAGKTTTVSITVRDSGGSVVTGAASGLAASIGGTNAGATASAISEVGSGVYSFTYTPAAAGTDSVAITLDSTAISGSPYSSAVAARVAISTAALPTPVVGVAYNQTVATSAGTAPVVFTITSGALPAGQSLAGSTGVISGTPTTAGAYSFQVTATDANSTTDARTYSGTIGAAVSITTASLATPVIGVPYNQTVATSGGTAPVTFAVTSGALPSGLSLAAASGAISGTPTTAGAYSFQITATDANSITDARTYSGTIGAAVAITTASLPTPVIGVAYNQTIAASGGTAPVAFAVSSGALPAGLSLTAATGAIAGTPTAAGVYSFQVTATDANGITDAKSYSGTIGSAVSITTVSLPTPVVGVAYTQTIATSGGTAPVTFVVTSGALPAGLSLTAASGAIAGTPTTAGAYSFQITATDANGITDAKSYSGTIGAAVSITTASLPTPVIGVAYSQTVAASGGTAPVTFAITSGGLPAGLSLTASTGTIAGTPTTAGAYSFQITATDANGITDAKTYSGTIGAAVSITTASLPTPVIGIVYSQTVATSGGTAPVTFAVSSGALPAGLSLTAATGTISGTPTTAGAYSFQVTATDANGITDAKTYSGTIGAAVAITTASLPTPVIGVVYSQTVAASGGTAPVTFAVSSGALPAGLSLTAASGAISGTPTTAGVYSFQVTATDANGITDAKTYSGTIGAAVAITTASLPTPVIGVAYNQTVAASGGTAPVTFAVIGGALPAGLSLTAATGTISGTPAMAGAYSFQITATDANGITDARTYSGTIGAAVSITTASLPTPVIGVAYSQTASTSGGTAPVTFAVTSGGLPAGLSLTAASGAISGTPTTAGAYSFQVTATDANGITDAKTYSGTIGAAVSITTASLPTPVIGVVYSQTVATSGGTAPVTFAVTSGALPAGLSLTAASGAISGTPTTAGAYSFQITATDANGITDARTYSGTIGAAVSITTASLPTPVIGVAYNQTVAASGGTAPVTFAVTGGALPAGLSLTAATGTISGTPAMAGAYSFQITATDANGITDAKTYAGTIGAAVSITTASLPTPVIGVAYSQTVAASGGTAPVTFSVTNGALPAGLSLTAASGAISGAPTTAGAYSFQVTATDANGITDARTYSGTIGAAVSITTASLPTPVIGVAYSQTVSTSGGTAPVTFAVTSGGLPAGLSLTAATGAISGTPTTSGAYSFQVTATDANGIADARTYSGAIGAAVTITTASLPTPVIGVGYSQTIATSGGTAPVSFSVTGGALPAGLSLTAASGAISGTPTTAGAYSFQVTATDANGVTDAQAYAGSIGAAVSITTASLPAPLASVPYSQTVATSGGTAPVSFAVTSGALPAGLSLDPASGAISGTTTAAGAYAFTVTATDGNGVTDAQAYAGNIGAAIAITTASLPVPLVNVPYSQTIATSGGTSPVTFAVTLGALPAGLALNSATGAVTGTPVNAGAYSFTVTATDAHGVSDAQAYSGVIGPGLTIVGAELPVPVVDVPYAETIVTSGGTGPVSFAVTAGALPDGLTLNESTGLVSGTPTTAGDFAFTITATDGNGVTDVRSYALTLAKPPPVADTTTATVAAAKVKNGSSVNVSLSELVSGDYDEIQIATPPAHGTVTLQQGSGLSAMRARTAFAGAATNGGGGGGYIAIYKPQTGYRGPDSFQFVAIGAGGSSNVATVTIDVQGQTPAAKSFTATAIDGQTLSFDLTTGVAEGPFTEAEIVSMTPATAATAHIVEGGTSEARTYRLEVTTKARFNGAVTISYRLGNAIGLSDPGTVTITVNARPNPAQDPVVRSLSDAQAETSRRFSHAQVDNVMRHAESLHGVDCRPGSMDVRLNPTASARPDLATDTRPGPEAPQASGAPAPTQDGAAASRGGHGGGQCLVSTWASGSIDISTRDPASGREEIRAATQGLTFGADVRLAPGLRVGVAGGFGHDRTTVGGAARLVSDSKTLVAYGSYAPGPGLFVDGMFSRGWLDFDTRRLAGAGLMAQGRRSGRFTTAALSVGIDEKTGSLDWSVYGRGEYMTGDLDAYVETGAGAYSLRFDRRRLRSVYGVVGFRGSYRYDTTFGSVTLGLRGEWMHDFAGGGAQGLDYADIPGASLYSVRAADWDRDQFALNPSVTLELPANWQAGIDVGVRASDGERSVTPRVQVQRKF